MAYPLTLYMPIRQGIFAQFVVKVVFLVHKLKTKPTANTGLIHYSRLIMVPKSASNRNYAGLFKRVQGLMLTTTFDGGMIPYFLAFWMSKKIRRTFTNLKYCAENPPPKLTGDEYIDYNNFQTWLADQDIRIEGFYSAYPQTMQQIYELFPDQNPS